MNGFFITFEGTEGSGKTTQIALLSAALRQAGQRVCVTREPGGTAIGEEIRHTLKHSAGNAHMTPATELLLINASRAQLVEEVIRPALAAGEVILCDRFYDSTIAYQGYGRGLDLDLVRSIIEIAVGETQPHLTLWLAIPLELSQQRRGARLAADVAGGSTAANVLRDRFEEADVAFFSRVEAGYQALARAEPDRVCEIDATRPVGEVALEIIEIVSRRSGIRLPTGAGPQT